MAYLWLYMKCCHYVIYVPLVHRNLTVRGLAMVSCHSVICYDVCWHYLLVFDHYPPELENRLAPPVGVPSVCVRIKNMFEPVKWVTCMYMYTVCLYCVTCVCVGVLCELSFCNNWHIKSIRVHLAFFFAISRELTIRFQVPFCSFLHDAFAGYTHFLNERITAILPIYTVLHTVPSTTRNWTVHVRTHYQWVAYLLFYFVFVIHLRLYCKSLDKQKNSVQTRAHTIWMWILLMSLLRNFRTHHFLPVAGEHEWTLVVILINIIITGICELNVTSIND